MVAALAWWTFVQQIVMGKPLGEDPAPDWGVWVLWVVIGLGLPLLFFFIRLVLEVTPDAVIIRYRPVTRRTILAVKLARSASGAR